MILLDLKKYIEMHQRVSMQQLSQFFNVLPETLRPMLSLCIQKGYVKLCERVNGCGSRCSRCSPLLTEIYEAQCPLLSSHHKTEAQ